MADNDENQAPEPKMIRVRNKHSAPIEGIEPGQEGEVDENNPGIQHALNGRLLEPTHGHWQPSQRAQMPADPFGPPPVRSDLLQPDGTIGTEPAVDQHARQAQQNQPQQHGEPDHERRSRRPPRE